MFKFLRKYSVWILGFGGTLLLIAFLAPNVIQQFAQRAGYAGTVQATVGDGEKVGFDDWQQNLVESQIIDRLDQTIPGIGEVESPSHWYLLSREADLAGLTPPLETIPISEQTFRTIVANTGARPQVVLMALAHLQGIQQLAQIYQSSGRFSDRRLIQAADKLLSSVTIETVVIPATPQDDVTFTDEALQAQLDAWADTNVGEGDHGFGYKIPDRFKVEWLHISGDSITEATKLSDEFSTREQRKFWRRNESDPNFPAVDASTEIPEVVTNAYLEQLTDQTRAKIVRSAAENLRSPRRGLEEINSFLDLPDNWDSMQLGFEQLAATIQHEYGISLPEYGALATWTTLPDANSVPVIGSILATNIGDLPVTFQELVASTQEFNNEGLYRIQEGVASKIIETIDGALITFRITATDPTRAPHNIDEVRDAVVHDLGRIAQWKVLQNEANSIEQFARQDGVLATSIKYNTVVNPARPVTLIETGVPSILDPATRRMLMLQSIIQRINVGEQIGDMASRIPTLDKVDTNVIQIIIDRAADLPIDTPLTAVAVEDRVFIVPSHENMALIVVNVTGTSPASSELVTEFSGGTQPILQTLLRLDELGGISNISKAFSFESLAKRHNFKRGSQDVEEDFQEEIETAAVN